LSSKTLSLGSSPIQKSNGIIVSKIWCGKYTDGYNSAFLRKVRFKNSAKKYGNGEITVRV